MLLLQEAAALARSIQAVRRFRIQWPEPFFLPPALTSAADSFPEAFDFSVFDVDVGNAKQRSYCLLRRTREISTDNMRQHVIAGMLCRFSWIIDIARAVFLVLDQRFFTENSQHRPHR